MNQKKINLAIYTHDSQRIQRIFKILRLFTFFYSIVISLAFVFFFIANNRLIKKLNEANIQKESLLVSLQSYKNKEANMLYISKKINLLDEYLNTDTKFIPYFNILSESLGNSSESASLSEFTIDKNRVAMFKVTFDNKEAMFSYLRRAESPAFIHNFSSLTLTSIKSTVDTIESGDLKTLYELTFNGKFNAIHENFN